MFGVITIVFFAISSGSPFFCVCARPFPRIIPRPNLHRPSIDVLSSFSRRFAGGVTGSMLETGIPTLGGTLRSNPPVFNPRLF